MTNKKLIALGLSLVSLVSLTGLTRSIRTRRSGKNLARLDATERLLLLEQPERVIGVDQASRRYLQYVVLPVWLGAGFLDWVWHRRTRIEQTSGTRESAIHSLMMTEMGIPILAGIFLESNALTLLVSILALVAHTATAVWDVAYAELRREVTDLEQHTHSFLTVLPFMAVSSMLTLYWDQALALLGIGRERPRFVLRPKRPPLSRRYVVGILSLVAVTLALPYAEELVRCLRANPTLAPTPVPPEEQGEEPHAGPVLGEERHSGPVLTH